jgi:hypothetical protein
MVQMVLKENQENQVHLVHLQPVVLIVGFLVLKDSSV